MSMHKLNNAKNNIKNRLIFIIYYDEHRFELRWFYLWKSKRICQQLKQTELNVLIRKQKIFLYKKLRIEKYLT